MHTGSKSELHLPNNCIQNANLLLSKLIEINQIFTGDMKYIHQRLLGEVNYIDVNVSVRLKWKIGLHFTSYLKSVQDGTYALGKTLQYAPHPLLRSFSNVPRFRTLFLLQNSSTHTRLFELACTVSQFTHSHDSLSELWTTLIRQGEVEEEGITGKGRGNKRKLSYIHLFSRVTLRKRE